MDYDELRLFLQLSRSLHFGRASREAHISVSALSRAIRRLEEHVGTPLFERDQRSVRLTPEGVRFREYATQVLDGLEAFKHKLQACSDVLAGTLRVFASVTACQSLLPRILSNFRERHPEVHIELETGYAANALDMLERGVVEVTVAALPKRLPRSLTSCVLTTTPLRFVAPTAACEVSRQVAQDQIEWDHVPLIIPPYGLARSAADQWFRRQRLRPRIYSEVLGHEAILSLVSLGCGVGIVPQLVIDKSPLQADVHPLNIEPPVGEFHVGVCTERRTLSSPIVAAFWDSISEAT